LKPEALSVKENKRQALCRVSIIVPVYKTEEYLDQCVQSLISQTYREIEIILVNDGSPDGSGEICNRYAREYPKLVKVIHQKNQGVAAARNTGMDAATGEWVMFVDSDDWVEPAMVEVMLSKSHAESCEICVCGYSSDYPTHKIEYNMKKLSGYSLTPGDKTQLISKVLLSTEWIGGYGEHADLTGPWAKLYRMNLIKGNSIRFPKDIILSEDIIFNLYAMQLSAKIAFCEGVFYRHRVNPQSATKRYQSMAFASTDLFISALEIFVNLFYQKGEAKIIYYTGATYAMFNAITRTYRAVGAPYSLKEKLRNIKKVKRNKVYRDIIKNASARYLPPGDRLRLMLIRFTPVWFFYMCMELLFEV